MASGQKGVMQMQPQVCSENIPLVHPAEGGPGQIKSWAVIVERERRRRIRWRGFMVEFFCVFWVGLVIMRG
jgi:hypothetical protein